MSIFDLFHQDITRKIEKVISYQAFDRNATDEQRQAAWRERLKSEISEYYVTDRLEANFEDILGKMRDAMEGGGSHEIGVWVSGFYGSGKSSFTKYLGFALDDEISLDGTIFREHLKNRLNKATTKALLDAVAKNFPATVVMLDLASEMIAGASQEEISTVLYLKVLQWAGYSENRKLASLEIRLESEGRYDEFVKDAEEELGGMPWALAHNDPLVMDEVVPALAHKFFPQFYKSPESFTTNEQDTVQFEDRRVEEMLDIVRRKSGRDHVIFIVDEVGQYVASRPELILNMDGLAKNLKAIGGGKAWLISTAQQTLTEDDPRAQLNAPELYKLNARFPISLDLVADDIKEIVYRRLLGKSPKGAAQVEKLFDEKGPAMVHATKLTTKSQKGDGVVTEYDKQTFVNLYPFLPYHFDILLALLGRLASRTGGLGLRSAIKVIQDILLEPSDARFSDRAIGDLANTVTLYDTLKTDIEKSFNPLTIGVESVVAAYGADSIHVRVAKSVAITQIVEEKVPATIENIAALMHPSVDSPSLLPGVKDAVEELLKNKSVSLSTNQEGELGFLSEQVNNIEKEKGELLPTGVDASRIFNDILRDQLSPAPKATLNGTATVNTGIYVMRNSTNPTPLSGDRERIQTHVHFADPTQYDATLTELVEDSRDSSKSRVISLIARTDSQRDELVREIFRCQKIHEKYRSDTDQQVKDYAAGQQARAETLKRDLGNRIDKSLREGSLIFRGQATAVATLGATVKDAASASLKEVAETVFDKHSQAPYSPKTNLAERFLKLERLESISANDDPGSLVLSGGGQTKIDIANPALQSIRDYLDRVGRPNGKELLETFGREPYRWSQDTTRYLVAGLLRAGEIVLHVANQDISVRGEEALAVLKSNQTFKKVGVSLRDNRPSNEAMSRASERLTVLTGSAVVPLEEDLSKATVAHFDRQRDTIKNLEAELNRLGLAGADRATALSETIVDTLRADGSHATQQLGGEESPLFNNLQWAEKSHKALTEAGLKEIVSELQELRRDLENLPNSGATATLRNEADIILKETVAPLLQNEDIYDHTQTLAAARTELQAKVKSAVTALHTELETKREHRLSALQETPNWTGLDPTEKSELLATTDGLKTDPGSGDLQELKKLVALQVTSENKLAELETATKERAAAKHRAKAEAEAKESGGKSVLQKTIKLPAKITDSAAFQTAMAQFHIASSELMAYDEIDITLKLED